jgi:hypothetical protein
MDDRGSKLQQFIYNLTVEAYSPYQVIYEYGIGHLQQRIDIFIPILGIAIEIHGEQHYNYTPFFHKDEVAWNYSVMLDTKKSNYLKEHGVKLIEIPFNSKIKTKEELIAAVDSVPYPDVEYVGIDTHSENKKIRLETQKKFRKEIKEKRIRYDY